MAVCSASGGSGNGALAYFSPLTFSIVDEIAAKRRNASNELVLVNKNTYRGKASAPRTNRTR